MDDHEILQHLLSVESEAAALVDDAQAEADRRISRGEKQNRIRYDEIYAGEADALEKNLVESVNAIKGNYHSQLELYRKSLEAQEVDMKAFSALAEKILNVKGR